jgi:hypothetical protein
VRKLGDRVLLANRAQWDENPRVRKTAIRRLEAEDLLAKIRDGDADGSVRAAAAERLADLAATARKGS